MKKHHLQINNGIVIAQSFVNWPNKPANVIEAPDDGNYLGYSWNGAVLTPPPIPNAVWGTGDFILAIGENALDAINSHAHVKAKLFSQYLSSSNTIDLNKPKVLAIINQMKTAGIITAAIHTQILAGE